MRRRLFSILSLLSLVLCCAVMVIWVWSYWRFVDFGRIERRRDAKAYTQSLVRLGSTHGTLLITWRDIVWPSSILRAASVSTDWEKAETT